MISIQRVQPIRDEDEFHYSLCYNSSFHVLITDVRVGINDSTRVVDDEDNDSITREEVLVVVGRDEDREVEESTIGDTKREDDTSDGGSAIKVVVGDGIESAIVGTSEVGPAEEATVADFCRADDPIQKIQDLPTS